MFHLQLLIGSLSCTAAILIAVRDQLYVIDNSNVDRLLACLELWILDVKE